MIVLLDTSTPVCRLAVVHDGVPVWHEWESGRGLAKGLLAFLREKTGDVKQISGIGIMKGPGSFTGLRIGITVANALADSLAIPIIGETGENWAERAVARLENGENDRVVLPLYGGEAHITQPRK